VNAIGVRPAHPQEYPRIGALTAEAFVDGGTEPDGSYAHSLRDAASRAGECEMFVAADAHDALVGAVCFALPGSPLAEVCRDDEAEFRMLAVDPAAQGRGVGAALVRFCCTRARALGIRAIAISTAERATSAQRLYERLGFVRVPDRDRTLDSGLRLIAYRIDLSAAEA
jgi:ribosomal protein S18 acetylase RimI-like enzyme